MFAPGCNNLIYLIYTHKLLQGFQVRDRQAALQQALDRLADSSRRLAAEKAAAEALDQEQRQEAERIQEPAARLETEQAQLQNEPQHLNEMSARLRAQAADAAAERERLEALEAQLEEADGELAAKRQELEEFEAQLDEDDAELAARRQELEGLEAQLNEVDGELAAKRQKLEAFESELNEDDGQLAAKRQELEAFESQLNEDDEELAARRQQLEALEAQLNEDDGDLAAQRQQLDALAAQLDADRSDLAAERRRLDVKSQELQAERQAAIEEEAELDAERQRLQERRREFLAARHRIQREHEALDREGALPAAPHPITAVSGNLFELRDSNGRDPNGWVSSEEWRAERLSRRPWQETPFRFPQLSDSVLLQSPASHIATSGGASGMLGWLQGTPGYLRGFRGMLRDLGSRMPLRQRYSDPGVSSHTPPATHSPCSSDAAISKRVSSKAAVESASAGSSSAHHLKTFESAKPQAPYLSAFKGSHAEPMQALRIEVLGQYNALNSEMEGLKSQNSQLQALLANQTAASSKDATVKSAQIELPPPPAAVPQHGKDGAQPPPPANFQSPTSFSGELSALMVAHSEKAAAAAREGDEAAVEASSLALQELQDENAQLLVSLF